MYINFNGTELLSSGATQNWTILGGAGTRRTGSNKNDIFHSIKGDTLVGGAGDDTYNLWDNTSTVVEAAGEGIDTVNVRFWGGITLSANVENVVLNSPGATWATGNTLNNLMIAGTAGATLNGGKGNDVLVGGTGADVFKIVKGNASDVIVNFRPGWDVVKLVGYDIGTFTSIKNKATQVGSDVSIAITSTETLVIRDVQLSSLKAADFNFLEPIKPALGMTTLTAAGDARNYHGWYVLNNAWGATGLVAGQDYKLSSSYNSSDMTKGTTFNWLFDAVTTNKTILAYPEVVFGYSPFNTSGSNPTDTAHVFPLRVSDMVGLTAKYDVSYQGNLGGFNVAFDIWLASSATASGKDVVTNEIMVWLHKGGFEPYGDLVGTYKNGDFTASIYHKGTYTAIVADKDWISGTIDVAHMVKVLQDMGYVKTTEYLRSVELGAEVVSGAGSLVIGNLDLRVESQNPAGGTTIKQVDGSGTTVSTTAGAPIAEDLVALPAISPVNAAFLETYKPGTVTTYDEYGAKTGSLKTMLLTEERANAEHYDIAGKYLGVDIVTIEKGTTIVEQHYDAAHKLIDAVKTIYNANGSIQTVSYDSSWIVQGSTLRTVEDGGVTMIKHLDGNWALTGAEKVTVSENAVLTQHFNATWALLDMDRVVTNADGSITTEHYDTAAKLTGYEVATTVKNVTTTRHFDAGGSVIETHTLTKLGDGTAKDLTHDAAGKIVDLDYYGTARNDTIVGSAYTNHFHGGVGSDTLTGGIRTDSFHFDTVIAKGDVDTIVNFGTASDKIVLHDHIFDGIGAVGQLSTGAFVLGTQAKDTNDRIIYDAASGAVFYDTDGSGAEAAIQLAIVQSDAALGVGNFFIL